MIWLLILLICPVTFWLLASGWLVLLAIKFVAIAIFMAFYAYLHQSDPLMKELLDFIILIAGSGAIICLFMARERAKGPSEYERAMATYRSK